MYNIYIQYIPYKAPKPSFFRTKYVRPFFSTPAPQMRAIHEQAWGEETRNTTCIYNMNICI